MKRLFLLVTLLNLLIGTSAFATPKCNELLAKKALIRAYPSQASDLNIKFGFESEFTPDKYSLKLLKFYAPDDEFNITAQEWRSWKDTETETPRLNWVKERIKQLFADKKSPGKLHKISKGPRYAFLPERLIVDYTGNFEIVVDPVDSFEEWKANLKTVQENIGPGSMQSTIGIPKSALFADDADRSKRELVGMLQLLADLDSLEKLEQGYYKSLKSPDSAAAKAFAHPYLGPMSAKKRQLLEATVELNIQGKGFDEDSRERVALMDDSFKYVGSSAYRPDLGGKDYIVFEVRDAHSNFALLTERIERLISIFTQSRAKFADAYALKAFDTEKSFYSLPKKLRLCLKTLFPPRFIDESIELSADEVLANQVYRNFAFPLRDWSEHARLGKLRNSAILKARTQYIESLAQNCEAMADGRLPGQQASVGIQAALARFAVVSGLRNALQERFFPGQIEMAKTP